MEISKSSKIEQTLGNGARMHPPQNPMAPQPATMSPVAHPSRGQNGKRTAAVILYALSAFCLTVTLVCWIILCHLNGQYSTDGPGTGWYVILTIPFYIIFLVLFVSLPFFALIFAAAGIVLFLLIYRNERRAAEACPQSGPISSGKRLSARRGSSDFDVPNGPISH